jgi:hypothetical protein
MTKNSKYYNGEDYYARVRTTNGCTKSGRDTEESQELVDDYEGCRL